MLWTEYISDHEDIRVLCILNMPSKNAVSAVKRPAGLLKEWLVFIFDKNSVTQICDLNLIISASLKSKKQRLHDWNKLGLGLYCPPSVLHHSTIT